MNESQNKPDLLSQSKSEEYLIAWISQNLCEEADISIYGNREGLLKLASMLVRVAEYDQSEGAFPDNDSLHCHIKTGLNTVGKDTLPGLTIGRVDSKNGSEVVRQPFPEIEENISERALSDLHI